MVFDLQEDPDEFYDLAKSDARTDEISRLYEHLAQWGRRMSQRVTKSDDEIIAGRGVSLREGILPFPIDGSEVPEELTEKYRGLVKKTEQRIKLAPRIKCAQSEGIKDAKR